MGKIILDREKCIGCGSCAALCPKYFEMTEDGKSSLKKGKKKKNLEELEVEKAGCAQETTESCPVQAIEIKN